MTTLRAVLFDVMGTLVHDPYREALEAGTGLSLEELRGRRDPEAWPRFECGELTEEEFWDLHRDVGIEIDVDAFHAARRASTTWLAGMPQLLDELAGTVRRIGATNYPRWADELAAGVLDGRLDELHASCHLGVRKPDRRFFDLLLGRAQLAAAEVLFVDDREDNVAGARAAGLRAHRFEGAADLRARLRREGVELPP